jgi:hypothetical protein
MMAFDVTADGMPMIIDTRSCVAANTMSLDKMKRITAWEKMKTPPRPMRREWSGVEGNGREAWFCDTGSL